MQGQQRAKLRKRYRLHHCQDLLGDFQNRLLAPGVNANERLLARDCLGNSNGRVPCVLQGIAALVDEADSVLIDDAATPLIISQKYKNESFNECCVIANGIAAELKEVLHYSVDYRRRRIRPTQGSIQDIRARADQLQSMWRSFERSLVVQLTVNARVFFERDRHHVVEDGKVIIVAKAPGIKSRTPEGGVHQAIEIKEGLEISDATKTMASMTFQRFFQLYKHLGATSGTVANSAENSGMLSTQLCANSTHRKRPPPAPSHYFRISKLSGTIAKRSSRSIKPANRCSSRPTVLKPAWRSLNACKKRPAPSSPQRQHPCEEAGSIAKAGQAQAITIATWLGVADIKPH